MGFGLGDAALSACAVYWISKKTGRHTVRLALTVAALMLMRKMRNRAAKRSLQKLGKKSGLKVLIVGTGFSGICAAIKMQEMGIEFVMLERHPNAIGGTWRDNTYPGCECDVKSALYSFSFAQNPNWSRRWAGQAEILEYMKNIVRDYDLEKHIRFGQEVSKLAWNEESKTWTATTNSSEEFIGNFVIAGCGQLRDPAAPPFPHSEYKGTTMHTAQWDHSVSFKGKNVACVGTGASAIQVVPRLAEEAASMTIYQRSPPWMVPKPDAANSWLKKTLFRHFSVLMSLTRAYEFCYGEVFYNIAISTKNPWFSKKVQHIGIKDMKAVIRSGNEGMYDAVLPSYDIGCKRVLLTSEWLQTVQDEKVELVTEKIEKLTATGVKTAATERAHDIIVYATGFKTQNFVFPIEITGENGLSLREAWSSKRGTLEPRAYLGMAVPKFPNFFMLYGPTTNLGSNSIIYMIESQMTQITGVLEMMLSSGKTTASVTENAYDSYIDLAKREINDTVFSKDCGSWYTNAEGVPINNYWGSAFSFYKLCEVVRENCWDFK